MKAKAKKSARKPVRIVPFGRLSDQAKIQRWEQVKRVLKALTPHERRKHWDMSDFGQRTPCGTTACAAGHAAMDPWFIRRGLELTFDKDGYAHTYTFAHKVDEFFGHRADGVFFNGIDRPVSAVIREIDAEIKDMRKLAANRI